VRGISKSETWDSQLSDEKFRIRSLEFHYLVGANVLLQIVARNASQRHAPQLRLLPPPPMTFRIGIISDTHGLLRPEAERRLAGVDHIIHGGDIGRPEIIDALRRIAPVTAIRGNVDIDDWAAAYPETEVVRLAGKTIYVLHDLKTLQIDPIARGIDVVVSGHSHVPKIDTADGVLYLNPGSAGRRRFRLPITIATIDVTPDNLRPEIHVLGDV
jgi:putative phosphoesterase